MSSSNYILVYPAGNIGSRITLNLPISPDEISDSGSVNYSSETILGRSSPIVTYISTDLREISFTLEVYRENLESLNVNKLLKIIRASAYPKYDSSNTVRPALIGIRFNDIVALGILKSYSISWKKPIINGKYQVCSIQISMSDIPSKSHSYIEIYGNNPGNPFNNLVY